MSCQPFVNLGSSNGFCNPAMMAPMSPLGFNVGYNAPMIAPPNTQQTELIPNRIFVGGLSKEVGVSIVFLFEEVFSIALPLLF